MDAWLTAVHDRIAASAGIPPGDLGLDADTERTLLELARVAAHTSGDRRNAPLLCYLLGVASRGADVDTLAAAVRGETAG